MNDILYVDWFLLSKLCLKRLLPSPLRMNMTNHNNTAKTREKAGIKVQNLTWSNLTNQSGLKRL